MNIKTILAYANSYGTKRTSTKYLVMHYTANKGDTAVNNGNYFAKSHSPKSGAHYFVDDTTIVSSTPEDRIAYSVGGKKLSGGGGSLHGVATNSNTINIELCNAVDSISEATLNNAVELVKSLMAKYNIDVDHVIRHWDVTGKNCPALWTGDNNALWLAFKAKLGATESTPTVVNQPTQNGSTGSSTLLQRGSRGEEVKKLQTMLNAVGYNCGKADGIFGSGTRSALVNFQKAHGLTADGIYGAKSMAKLEEVYNCKPSEVKPQQTANTSVVEGQKFLGVTADGIVGANTRKAYARYVQTALNADYSAGLAVNGIIGNATIRALGNHYVKKGERQNLVKVVQCGLSLLGYSVNGIDGIFGSGLESAVRTFQASKGLSADGIAGKNTIINIWKALGVY